MLHYLENKETEKTLNDLLNPEKDHYVLYLPFNTDMTKMFFVVENIHGYELASFSIDIENLNIENLTNDEKNNLCVECLTQLDKQGFEDNHETRMLGRKLTKEDFMGYLDENDLIEMYTDYDLEEMFQEYYNEEETNIFDYSYQSIDLLKDHDPIAYREMFLCFINDTYDECFHGNYYINKEELENKIDDYEITMEWVIS